MHQLKVMYDAYITGKFWRYRKKGTVEVESKGRMSFEISLRGYP